MPGSSGRWRSGGRSDPYPYVPASLCESSSPYRALLLLDKIHGRRSPPLGPSQSPLPTFLLSTMVSPPSAPGPANNSGHAPAKKPLDPLRHRWTSPQLPSPSVLTSHLGGHWIGIQAGGFPQLCNAARAASLCPLDSRSGLPLRNCCGIHTPPPVSRPSAHLRSWSSTAVLVQCTATLRGVQWVCAPSISPPHSMKFVFG